MSSRRKRKNTPTAIMPPDDCVLTDVNEQLYHGSHKNFSKLELPEGDYRWTEDDDIPSAIFMTKNYDVAALYSGRDYGHKDGTVYLVNVQMDNVADCRGMEPGRKLARNLMDAGMDGAIIDSTVRAHQYDSPEYLIFNPDETTEIAAVNRNHHERKLFVPMVPEQGKTKSRAKPKPPKGLPKLPGKSRRK